MWTGNRPTSFHICISDAHTAKTNHIIQLVTDLAKTLVGSNVLEVQADSGARTPFMPGIFVNLGMGKIHEICVLSRNLEFRNSIASLTKPLPKWITRQFIQVSSETLLKGIRIVLKDTQPEVPIFGYIAVLITMTFQLSFIAETG